MLRGFHGCVARTVLETVLLNELIYVILAAIAWQPFVPVFFVGSRTFPRFILVSVSVLAVCGLSLRYFSAFGAVRVYHCAVVFSSRFGFARILILLWYRCVLPCVGCCRFHGDVA